MANEYLIQKETLDKIAEQIRLYAIPVGNNTHVFSWGSTTIPASGIKHYFYENFDPTEQTMCAENSHKTDLFYSAEYGEDNQGNIVPVLCEANGDKYYYVGVAEMGGLFLDKWRKIEVVHDEDNTFATWDSDYRSYCYTERVVQLAENPNRDTLINPVDFPEKITEVYYADLYDGTINLSY